MSKKTGQQNQKNYRKWVTIGLTYMSKCGCLWLEDRDSLSKFLPGTFIVREQILFSKFWKTYGRGIHSPLCIRGWTLRVLELAATINEYVTHSVKYPHVRWRHFSAHPKPIIVSLFIFCTCFSDDSIHKYLEVGEIYKERPRRSSSLHCESISYSKYGLEERRRAGNKWQSSRSHSDRVEDTSGFHSRHGEVLLHSMEPRQCASQECSAVNNRCKLTEFNFICGNVFGLSP